MHDIYEVKIEKFDHQGRGIGYLNNKIIFIPFAIPGDIVKIEVIVVQKKYMEGKVVEYVEKDEKHIKNDCPYFEQCGGCALRHISYDDELLFKENKVKEILTKFTKENIKINKIIGSEVNSFYRNKIKFSINKQLGLIKRNTHDIINVDTCLLASPKINELVRIINTYNLEDVNSITIRNSWFTNETMLVIDVKDKRVAQTFTNLEKYVDSLVITKNGYIENIIGKGNIIERLNNLSFKISDESFFQVNSRQTVNLYNLILEKASLSGKEIVYDLFCGTGTIGIYLSSMAKKVIGVEINKEAYLNALENKKINNISNIEFYNEDVTKFVGRNLEKPDTIIFDPPRAGLNEKIISTIKKFNPQKIIYVSCDPVTLARDLKEFSAQYEIVDVTPVDMFPRTYHVETVCILTRREPFIDKSKFEEIK